MDDSIASFPLILSPEKVSVEQGSALRAPPSLRRNDLNGTNRGLERDGRGPLKDFAETARLSSGHTTRCGRPQSCLLRLD